MLSVGRANGEHTGADGIIVNNYVGVRRAIHWPYIVWLRE